MSLKNITYLLIFFCLIGTQVVSIDIGSFQLSPYRLFLVLLPVLLFGISKTSVLRKVILIRSDYVYLLGLWLLYSALSFFWVIDYASWGRSLFYLMGGFISTIFIFSFLDCQKKIFTALKLVIFTSITIGGIAIYEIQSGIYFFVNSGAHDFHKESTEFGSQIFYAPLTIFGNPNNYAVFLYLSCIFCFISQRLSTKKLESYFYLCSIGFFILLITLTQSRSGFMALLCFFFTYFFVRSLLFGVFFWIKSVIFGIAIISFLSLFYFEDLNRLTDFISVDFNSAEVQSDTIRLNLILNGLNFLYHTLFLGVGIGQIEPYMESLAIYPTMGVTNIHNWWLELLVSLGLLCFLFYLFVYIRTAFLSINIALNATDPSIKVVNIIVFSFLVSFPFASIGPSSLVQTEWIWPMLALMMKLPYVTNDPREGLNKSV